MIMLRGAIVFLLCAAFVAVAAPPARSQWVCTVTDSGTIGGDITNAYWYTALSCSGNRAVVAADVDGAIGGDNGFYLAFLISSDGGQTWSLMHNGLPGPTWSHQPIITKIDQIDSLNIVAFGDSDLLVRTTDGGADWQELTSPSKYAIVDLSFSNPVNGMLVVQDSVQNTFVTSDGGLDWSPSPFIRDFVGHCHDYGNGMYRLFTLDKGLIYSTRDGWNTVDSTGPPITDSTARRYVYLGCAFGTGDSIFAFGYRIYPGRGNYPFILQTTTGGQKWTVAYKGDPTSFENEGLVQALSDLGRSTIVAGISSLNINRVLTSTDHGTSWSFDTLILPANYWGGQNFGIGVNSDGNLLGAYTFNGADGPFLLRGTRAPAEVHPDRSRSDEVELYPNPASNVLCLSGLINLKTLDIIDALGRVLITAVPTDRTLTLNISQLPPGIYFVTDGITRMKFVKE